MLLHLLLLCCIYQDPRPQPSYSPGISSPEIATKGLNWLIHSEHRNSVDAPCRGGIADRKDCNLNAASALRIYASLLPGSGGVLRDYTYLFPHLFDPRLEAVVSRRLRTSAYLRISAIFELPCASISLFLHAPCCEGIADRKDCNVVSVYPNPRVSIS